MTPLRILNVVDTTRAIILKRAFGRIGIADYEFDVASPFR
jgi:hypothetical protein